MSCVGGVSGASAAMELFLSESLSVEQLCVKCAKSFGSCVPFVYSNSVQTSVFLSCTRTCDLSERQSLNQAAEQFV